MKVITANDLKIRGISAIEEGLEDQLEASITVRGSEKYVVMRKEHYNHLREIELEAAFQEVCNDMSSGNRFSETAEEHVKRVYGL